MILSVTLRRCPGVDTQGAPLEEARINLQEACSSLNSTNAITYGIYGPDMGFTVNEITPGTPPGCSSPILSLPFQLPVRHRYKPHLLYKIISTTVEKV